MTDPWERYEDLGRIGQGGLAEVRRVRDRHLEATLAMKILGWEHLEDDDAREAFSREARITAALAHPGVVAVQELGELPDGRLWYTMTEVAGRTLASLQADVSLQAGAETLVQVARALAHAHERGIAHRDLKPENVMIGAFGEVRVMDWGLAAPVDGDQGLRGGTPAWMAPEQVQGKAGREADVYAMGGLLLFLVSGEAPRRGSVAAMVDAHKRGEAIETRVRCAGAPSTLRELCRRCLSMAPAARPTMPEVLGELEAWTQGARKRQEALALVDAADALAPDIEALAERALALHAEAALRHDAIPAGGGLDDRRASWQLEDEALALDAEHAVLQTRWLESLHAALVQSPTLDKAHRRLAIHHRAQLAVSRRKGDAAGVARDQILLDAHARGEQRTWVEPRGRVRLDCEVQASVQVDRLVPKDRRLQRQAGQRHPTPLDLRLEVGSYVLRLRASGCPPLDVPVHIGAGEQAELGTIDPRVAGPQSTVRVLGGVATLGRTAERVEVAEFFMARNPVTEGQYQVFLDELGEEAGLRRVPRAAATGALLARWDRTRWVRRADPDGYVVSDDMPVTRVDWYAATAYAAWLSERSGHRWRLPSAHEWEKAARGVDGRRFVTGPRTATCWGHLASSQGTRPRRVAVGTPAEDISVYGVQGLLGGVREWCGGVDPTSLEPRVTMGGSFKTEARPCWVRDRVGPGERSEDLGFRLVCGPLPPGE